MDGRKLLYEFVSGTTRSSTVYRKYGINVRFICRLEENEQDEVRSLKDRYT